MSGWLRTEVQGFFDLLFPPACAFCQTTLSLKTQSPFCESCTQGIRPLPSGRCPRCALPFVASDSSSHLCAECSRTLPPFLSVHSAGLYEAGLRELVHRFKFEQGHYLDRGLAQLMHRVLDPVVNPDIIIPVPLHNLRLRQRTYNQSLLLARELAGRLARPVSYCLLERVRNTRQQQGLRAVERAQNLRGAFLCRSQLDGEKILLVDDVMTTGATAAACSRVLLDAGASEVRVVVAGRAGRS
jgi:ComF family protein